MEKIQVLKKGNTSIIYMIIAAIIVIGAIAWFATRQGTMAPTKDDNTAVEEKEDT